MRKYRMGKIGLVLLLFVPLSACWDRREVNDVAIVLGSAIDKSGDGYQMSAQFPLPGQLGGSKGGGGGTSGQKSWYMDSGKGKTVNEAEVALQQSASRQLYFSHRRVLVFGEEMARSGITSALDVVTRIPQNRLSVFIVFTKGKAVELMNADASMEQTPSEMIRELSVNSMRKPRTLKLVLNMILSKGVDLVAPYMVKEMTRPGKSGEKKSTITIKGLAVFHRDRLTGFLNGEAAQGALWLMSQANSPSLTVKSPNGSGLMSLQFQENHTDIKPIIKGETITMMIDVYGRGVIRENESNLPARANNLKEIQNAASAKVKSMVEKSIRELQELHSDGVGFGLLLSREQPKKWRQWADHWDDMYPKVKTDVSVHLLIENSGTLIEPIGNPPRGTSQ